jgi:hypothetical protein
VDDEGNLNVSPGGNDSWLAGSGVCAANIGNLNGSSQEMDIWPDPDNVIPLGIKKRYRIYAVEGSYTEFSGS